MLDVNQLTKTSTDPHNALGTEEHAHMCTYISLFQQWVRVQGVLQFGKSKSYKTCSWFCISHLPSC